jgi:hypothetical protein
MLLVKLESGQESSWPEGVRVALLHRHDCDVLESVRCKILPPKRLKRPLIMN